MLAYFLLEAPGGKPPRQWVGRKQEYRIVDQESDDTLVRPNYVWSQKSRISVRFSVFVERSVTREAVVGKQG